MTNGRGGSAASMALFMTRKKKYKFQVEICLEELLEVSFVSAVLFAKLRLVDKENGKFLDYSSRQEVRDHKVHWDANFLFPCKMVANASTGVMEKCILRISLRKECNGGRSFDRLGFVDLNLAEYAGAGVIHKKALLEGYDAKHRQDNSMLKYRIQLKMITGDIMFKAPSPTLKHKQINVESGTTDQRSDEFSSESLAGSIASASSGFGSLPKKRPPLLSSDLVAAQPLAEVNTNKTKAPDSPEFSIIAPSIGERLEQLQDSQPPPHKNSNEQGHSRNSSNTSQLSKASGYSTQHSRQSSSGDSVGHMRHPHHSSLRTNNNSSSAPSSKFMRAYTIPKQKINIPTTIMSESFNSSDGFHTPVGCHSNSTPSTPNYAKETYHTPQNEFETPRRYYHQKSNLSSGSEDVYKTPEVNCSPKNDVFSNNFNALQKSASSSVVENVRNNVDDVKLRENIKNDINDSLNQGVLRSKSEFLIPVNPVCEEKPGPFKFFKSDSLFSFLTPRPNRKISAQSTPTDQSDANFTFRLTPPSLRSSFRSAKGHPPPSPVKLAPDAKATSLNSLRVLGGVEGNMLGVPGKPQGVIRLHRKMLLDTSGNSTNKIAVSPEEAQNCEHTSVTPSSDDSAQTQRRLSNVVNPSSGSLAPSETGSLERPKSAFDKLRPKKNATGAVEESSGVSGKVEITRVNPEDILDEVFKTTKLEPDDSSEASGLQLFITQDGRAALGNHEVKSQMSTGVQTFKRVVMDNR